MPKDITSKLDNYPHFKPAYTEDVIRVDYQETGWSSSTYPSKPFNTEKFNVNDFEDTVLNLAKYNYRPKPTYITHNTFYEYEHYCNGTHPHFTESNVSNFSFKNSRLNNVRFDKATACDSNFEATYLENVYFADASLNRANFSNSKSYDYISFENADLTGANFKNCYYSHINMINVTVKDCNFKGFHANTLDHKPEDLIYGIDIFRSRLSGTVIQKIIDSRHTALTNSVLRILTKDKHLSLKHTQQIKKLLQRFLTENAGHIDSINHNQRKILITELANTVINELSATSHSKPTSANNNFYDKIQSFFPNLLQPSLQLDQDKINHYLNNPLTCCFQDVLAQKEKSTASKKEAADIMVVDINKLKEGYTQLHRAVGQNKMTTLTKLIQQGANLETKSSTGKTALQIAVEHNVLHAVPILLESGANDNVTVGKLTLLQFANQQGFTSIARCLAKHRLNNYIRTTHDRVNSNDDYKTHQFHKWSFNLSSSGFAYDSKEKLLSANNIKNNSCADSTGAKDQGELGSLYRTLCGI